VSSRGRDDLDLEELARATYSAAVSDACDRAGLRYQTLEPGIVPCSGSGVLVGWARVARSVPVGAPPSVPYAAEIAFLDSLAAGDVVVATAGGAPAAIWGELFSAAAKARGARGAIVDGLARDLLRVRELGFNLYARGTRPTDSLGRTSLVDTEGPCEVAGVEVSNGDLVFADIDGVVVVPRKVAGQVVGWAVEKSSTERKALAMLREGALLKEIWERYKVL
jgi:4-hydroxy-4-methyl-2-oxoglutarate aldolase